MVLKITKKKTYIIGNIIYFNLPKRLYEDSGFPFTRDEILYGDFDMEAIGDKIVISRTGGNTNDGQKKFYVSTRGKEPRETNNKKEEDL